MALHAVPVTKYLRFSLCVLTSNLIWVHSTARKCIADLFSPASVLI